jgi:hypothetical protein
MDDGKPSIPLHDLRSQLASVRPSAADDPARAALVTSNERVAPEGQSRSGQIEPCRTDFSDAPSVAIYYRDEEEVRRGFFIALSAMGPRTCRRVSRAGNEPRPRGKAVKTPVFPYLLPLCMLFLFACGPTTASRSPADAITFDSAKRLDDFDFAASGDGGPGEWLVIDNDTGRGLAQIKTESAENRFAIYRPFSARDAYVSTRFMTISGKINQAAGIFVRFRSPDDYYAVSANALENNVILYRVVARGWQMIGCMEVNVMGQAWHTLGIAARDDRLTVFFDDRELFVATDRRFPAPPGKVGLWTQTDSMTLFENLKIESLD